jgi:4a-hydroxytetrahydrobiopterin dehydratase
MQCDLTNKHCKPCEGGVAPLTEDEANALLKNLDEWQLTEDNKSITRKLSFKGFNKVMGFINAIAWIANAEQHHPDVAYGYNYCSVTFTTHAINGLSENDFICAAKVDQLFN